MATSSRPARTETTVAPGMTFRSIYADANALWKVVARAGRNVWHCEIENEPFEVDGVSFDSDYAGTRQPFATSAILANVNRERAFTAMRSADDAWWDERAVGETLHYHNGFGQYVRGLVVVSEGEKRLRPTALVGAWRPTDLPRRQADGTVYRSSMVTAIDEGRPWRPSSTTIFEARGSGSRPYGDQHVNPKDMPELDLTVPAPTPEENESYRIERLLAAVRDASQDYRKSAQERLAAVKALLED